MRETIVVYYYPVLVVDTSLRINVAWVYPKSSIVCRDVVEITSSDVSPLKIIKPFVLYKLLRTKLQSPGMIDKKKFKLIFMNSYEVCGD